LMLPCHCLFCYFKLNMSIILMLPFYQLMSPFYAQVAMFLHVILQGSVIATDGTPISSNQLCLLFEVFLVNQLCLVYFLFFILSTNVSVKKNRLLTCIHLCNFIIYNRSFCYNRNCKFM
ncbi:hypothetical protein ACJX0J_039598, partial [Zea mays]